MTMPIPDGSAITTPSQMLTEIQQLHGEFRELRGALTPTLDELRHQAAADRKDIETLFGRQTRTDRKVTRMQAQLAAAWAALGLILVVAGIIYGHGS